ncbi:carboxypeptidase-like regulatory domain-containing protein [Seonamhaeicola maritimus]|uniref:carboxypeptidase-like regulatory domain-containing protein n=1 Tax=Seonamhaeicola maritimus TaxID=2591822 RepID=UPI001F4FED24|nr:carboxypeptidase-like regulatory domain-containing protein [Seonamhaeicola maritimus]
MIRRNSYLLIFFLLFTNINFSQSVEILGRVISKTDVENIHVINKTAKSFTVTNREGAFRITAKVNDTLQFSSIQQGVKNVIISKDIITSRTMLLQLDEQVNELEEVIVGKVLSGNLISDIKNADDDRPINFYDVGIPGYKGKIATQSERRLSEAGEFKPLMFLGLLTGGLPLNPILNGISGRTKMLKERVELEHRQELLRKIKSDLSDDFFGVNDLEEGLRTDFFYFCAEAPDFKERCSGMSDLEIFEFLKEKLQKYKKNLQLSND